MIVSIALVATIFYSSQQFQGYWVWHAFHKPVSETLQVTATDYFSTILDKWSSFYSKRSTWGWSGRPLSTYIDNHSFRVTLLFLSSSLIRQMKWNCFYAFPCSNPWFKVKFSFSWHHVRLEMIYMLLNTVNVE